MHYRHHDSLWKGLLHAFFPEFLGLFVPEIAARLKPEERRFLEQEAFTDPPGGQQALLDVVAEVPSRGGGDEVVLIHVEVERTFGAAMDRRMWRYFAHLSLKYAHGIVPIVLFLRGSKDGISTRDVVHRTAGFEVNRFTYWSLGLSGLEAKGLLAHPPLGAALAACARGDRLPRDQQKYLCMQSILESDVDGAEEHLLLTAVETYLELNEEQKMKYAERVEMSPNRRELRTMELTWAGKLHEKGHREGFELGRQEGLDLGRQEGLDLGRQEGLDLGRKEGLDLGRRRGVELGLRLLTRILDRRFGASAGPLMERIARLDDPDRIEAISGRALDAESVEEIEALVEA